MGIFNKKKNESGSNTAAGSASAPLTLTELNSLDPKALAALTPADLMKIAQHTREAANQIPEIIMVGEPVNVHPLQCNPVTAAEKSWAASLTARAQAYKPKADLNKPLPEVPPPSPPFNMSDLDMSSVYTVLTDEELFTIGNAGHSARNNRKGKDDSSSANSMDQLITAGNAARNRRAVSKPPDSPPLGDE